MNKTIILTGAAAILASSVAMANIAPVTKVNSNEVKLSTAVANPTLVADSSSGCCASGCCASGCCGSGCCGACSGGCNGCGGDE